MVEGVFVRLFGKCLAPVLDESLAETVFFFACVRIARRNDAPPAWRHADETDVSNLERRCFLADETVFPESRNARNLDIGAETPTRAFDRDVEPRSELP